MNTYYGRTKRDDHFHLKGAFPFMQCRSFQEKRYRLAMTSYGIIAFT
jgi:hypothetical protein